MECILDFSFLETEINNIKFSHREVDIISCIINGRSPKFIAQLLDISPKTVESHIRNIKIKVNRSSKEQLVSFVEKSSKYQLISQHYKDLIINAEFERTLQEISLELANKNLELQIICLIKNDTRKDIKCCKLIKHLFMSGIKANLECKSVSNLDFKVNNCVLVCSAQTVQEIYGKYKEQIKNMALDGNKGPIFFTDGSLDTERKLQIISYTNPNNYYSATLELIGKLYGIKQIESLISRFRDLYEGKVSDFYINDQIVEDKYFWNKYKISIVVFMILISILLTYCFSHFYISSGSKYINLYTQFISKDILLPRKDLIHKIDEVFSKQNGIKYAILMGEGGMGKTVISRYYLQLNDFKVKAEINAETYNSLSDSFINLAIILANSKEQQEKLSYIRAITDYKRRNKQVFLFVLSRLKEIGNWCLLFDNVDDFNLIRDFITSNDYTHNNDGRIIITTRNENFKNIIIFPQFCVINVPLLTVNEREELFSKIMLYGNRKEKDAVDKSVLKSFLKNMPFMPLDICMAAFYIKNTRISFDDYLKISKNPCQSTEKIQSTFLMEGINYDKTRYGIISPVFEKIIKINADFKELLLFMCLLDSQNISISCLEKCKNRPIVQDFIYHLRRYSLITEKNDAFSIHRNTQEIGLKYILSLLPENEKIQSIDNIISNVANYKDFAEGWYPEEDNRNFQYKLKLAPHLEAINKKLKFCIGESQKDLIEKYHLMLSLSLLYISEFSQSPLELLNLSNSILNKSHNFNNVFSTYDIALFYLIRAKICSDIGDIQNCVEAAKSAINLAKKINADNILLPSLMYYTRYRKRNNSVLGEISDDDTNDIEKYFSLSTKLSQNHIPAIIETANQYYRYIGNNYINKNQVKKCVQRLVHQVNSLPLDKIKNKAYFVDFLEIKMNIVRAYNKLGNFESASKVIDELLLDYNQLIASGIDVRIKRARLLVERAFCLLRRSNIFSAYQIFSHLTTSSLLKDITDLFYVYVYRSEASIRLGRFEEAYKDCISALNYFESRRCSRYGQLMRMLCYYNMIICSDKMKKQIMIDKYIKLFFNEAHKFCSSFLSEDEFNRLVQEGEFSVEKENMSSILKKCKNIFEKIYGEKHSFVTDYVAADLNKKSE